MVALDSRNRPAAAQYPLDGSQSRGRFRQVLQHEAEEDVVKMLVAKGEIKQVRHLELDIPVAGGFNPRAGLIERVRRNVHRDNPRRRAPRREKNRLRPRAAATFEHQLSVLAWSARRSASRAE